MSTRRTLLYLALPFLLLAAGHDDAVHVGAFSRAAAGGPMPAGWVPLTFDKIDRQTTYTLVEQGGTVVIRAESEASASGLVRQVRIDPKEFPILEWRWRTDAVLQRGDVSRKDGDDYSARLYVTFGKDPAEVGLRDRLTYKALRLLGYDEVPLRALNYLWASRAPEGRIVPNPYTDWVMMIPVESGCGACGQWVRERRNIYDDYRAAFGEEPPAITGIALMTDTDNTGERAVAYYGDITFRAR